MKAILLFYKEISLFTIPFSLLIGFFLGEIFQLDFGNSGDFNDAAEQVDQSPSKVAGLPRKAAVFRSNEN